MPHIKKISRLKQELILCVKIELSLTYFSLHSTLDPFLFILVTQRVQSNLF